MWVFPAEMILKSVPVVPIAKIWVIPVSPLIDPILLLKVVQSVAERAPVIVDDARASESPVPDIERPFGEPDMNPSLLLNNVKSEPSNSPVALVVALPMAIETFGQTVAFVPFVIVIAELAVLIDPKVSAFCFMLNAFQSV